MLQLCFILKGVWKIKNPRKPVVIQTFLGFLFVLVTITKDRKNAQENVNEVHYQTN